MTFRTDGATEYVGDEGQWPPRRRCWRQAIVATSAFDVLTQWLDLEGWLPRCHRQGWWRDGHDTQCASD